MFFFVFFWCEQILFEAVESQWHRSRYSLTFLGFTSESLHFVVPSALPLFFLVEISGFFRADINIFNSLLAKQPLKSQAVAFPSCFVELEHILLFGDQVFRHWNLNPSCSKLSGRSELTWFGWSIDQALQPASVHSSATALFLSRKISYALVVPTSIEIWQWKGKDDQHVDLRAVGSNRFAGSRGVRHGRLWGHKLGDMFLCYTNALDLFEIGWKIYEAFHLPGCLWNGWSTACSTLLLYLSAFSFWLVNCPSVCLATCPAWSTDCSCSVCFSIFGLQHASLFAQKLKVKWLADTRSPFCYCIHIFFKKFL